MNLFGKKEKPFGWSWRKIISPDGDVFIVNSLLAKRLSLETHDRASQMGTVRIAKLRKEDWKIAEYKDDPKMGDSDPMRDLKGFETVIINNKGEIK